MSSLQPLYDVKERLEYAAIAGTGLLSEDFRLQRSAEAMKPLAAASPVFGKISAGLDKLLSAPGDQRPGLLLDVLSLVDAVAYTQGTCGLAGDIQDLPTVGGAYREISYGQLTPLLTALTTTGGGRLETIKANWETHPEYFSDFRVLPALVNGLGDSYGEISNFNADILKDLGPIVLPLLKADFDPAGKRGMARRVEVIAAVEGEGATPWLQAVLPEAKKDVRTAVLSALGNDTRNTKMLLELAKTERGGNREAVLASLGKQNGEEVRSFWGLELKQNGESVKFLRDNRSDWAAQLVASGLRERLEAFLSGNGVVPQKDGEELANCWCFAIGRKASPAMLDFWRWACNRMDGIDKLQNGKGNSILMGVRLSDCLLDTLCANGPGPVCDFCLTLWPEHPNTTRYLIHSFLAALMTRPAAEVYETYSPYILTKEPILNVERKTTLNNVLLRAFTWVLWHRELKRYCVQEESTVRFENVQQQPGIPTAGPLDPRWLDRLTHAVRKEVPGYFTPFGDGCVVDRFTVTLMNLIDRDNPELCAKMIPYLKDRMLHIPTDGKGIQENQFSVFAYSRYLLLLGGSPKGVLGEAMARFPGKYQAVFFWQQLGSIAQALPAEEAAQVVEEIDVDLCFNFTHTTNISLSNMMRQAMPFAAASLRAGQPFPEWNEIVKFQ